MSYTEYLRRKAAAEPVILNTKKPTDASMMTQKARFEANRIFSQVQSQFVGSLKDGKDRTGYPLGMTHPSSSYIKSTGRPAAASDFTAWRGGQGIGNDAAYNRGKILQQSCAGCVPTLAPAPKQASQITREKIYTQQGCVEPHTSGKLGSVFVDTTIRLSSGVPQKIADSVCCFPSANHEIKDVSPYNPNHVRPEAPGMVVNPSGVYEHPGTGRKVGALVESYYPKYIERHHGNDLFVNRKQPIVKYQIPAGSPAHLKINDPTFANVKPY